MEMGLNFISGFMLGFEIIDSNDLEGWEEDITFVVVDLFIIRLTISW